MALLREGQNVRGTYEVERLLGAGAFGEVYRVRHRFLGKQAMKVFKVVSRGMADTEDLLSEARLLSAMGHPNIIRLFDANTVTTAIGEVGFFTMEYVAGGSLEQFWQSHGRRRVPVSTSVDILRQACRGLAVAHGEDPPIIHRDIKPQNILVGYDATGVRVRVSDFGLAKRVNPLTLLASARGTPMFKSPEALLDPKKDSCAGDVWALGSTLYLLLTDRLPVPEASESSFNPRQYFSRPIQPPSRYNILVDDELDRIVMRALAVRNEQRYPDARFMLNELEAWSPPVSIPPQEEPFTSADESKGALGSEAVLNENAGRHLAAKAFELSKDYARLSEAADVMEEAFNQWPPLRQEHQYRVQLWRRGISM